MTESDEVMVHLEESLILARRIKRIPTDKCLNLISKYIELSKQLNSLWKTWDRFAHPSKK